MSNCEHVMEGPHQHACSPTNIWTKRSTSHHRVDSTKQLSKAAGNDTANIHFTTIMIASQCDAIHQILCIECQHNSPEHAQKIRVYQEK